MGPNQNRGGATTQAEGISRSSWFRTAPGVWRSILGRGLLFSAVWWILVDGEAASWWIGVPVVVLAILASAALLPPVNLVWFELLKFVPFFLVRSFLGGVDVAWRALRPSRPIAPQLIEFPLQLPSGLPSVFLANTVSLLPGTLSAELDSSCLKVHVLNERKYIVSELEDLEQRVASIFDIAVEPHGVATSEK